MNRTRSAIALVTACVVAAFTAPGALAAEAWEQVGGTIGAADPVPAGFDLKRIDGAPTVAYAHWNGTNHEIRVVRHHRGGWEPVGTQVNADPAHEATRPSLAAGPGGVPWVTWIERDDDGITQVRAARYSESKDRFVEPVGGDWPIQPRPIENWDPALFYGHRAQLVFVGSRPHLQFIAETPSEFRIGIARLAADRRSWRFISDPPRFAPLSFTGTVIGGVLHTSFNSRLGGSGVVDRLGPSGWEQVGGPIVEAGDSFEGFIAQLAAAADTPYAAWNPCCGDTRQGRVARLENGHWTDTGDGLGGRALDLRFIGGRLWASSSMDGIRASRLNGDATAWLPTPGIAAAAGGVLTGVDGVPHLGWLDADGRVHVSRLTGMAPVGADDNDGSASPCPNAGPDITKPVLAPPLPAEWPPKDPPDNPDTSCAMVHYAPPPDDGGPGPNPPGPPGGIPPGGDPPGPGPGPNPPGPPAPVAGPCGLRLLGTPKADRLKGDGARNQIAGRAGADTIFGLGGDDCLTGNAGNDVLKGGPGADRLSGDSGNDRLVGGDGNDSVKAGAGNDVVDARGRGFDTIDCGPGRDRALVGDLDRVRNCERVLNVD